MFFRSPYNRMSLNVGDADKKVYEKRSGKKGDKKSISTILRSLAMAKLLVRMPLFFTEFFCFILFMSCFSSKAYIYDLRVLRKWDEEKNRYCYFLGLGDFHDRTHSVTQLQLKQLDSIFLRCNRERCKLMVEDVCSVPNSGTRLGSNFCINSTGGLLGGIAKRYVDKEDLEKLDHDFIQNIEFRFCRVASLAPVINNISADLKSISSTSSILVECLKNEIMDLVNEINGYKDTKVLKDLYKQAVDFVVSSVNYLKFDMVLKKSVADYLNLSCNNAGIQARLNFVKKLLVFDSCLLDAKVVHSIVSESCKVDSKKQNFIVIAGGSHIRNVSQILQMVGYKPVYESKIEIKNIPEIGVCANSASTIGQNGCGDAQRFAGQLPLGSSVGGSGVLPAGQMGLNNLSANQGVCCKPEPTDLSVLDRFI